MEQFNTHSIQNSTNASNTSVESAKEKLKSFIKNLDSLSIHTSKNFKPELVNHLKNMTFSLKAFIDNPQQNTTSMAKSAENLLNYIAEANPEFLESNNEELNIIKKKNKKTAITELINLKQTILGGFATSKLDSNTAKIAPVSADFSTKLKLFASLNSSSNQTTVSSKKDVLNALGLDTQTIDDTLDENFNLFNTILSLALKAKQENTNSAESLPLTKNTKDITVGELIKSITTEETDTSTKLGIELIQSLLQNQEIDKLQDTFLNLESSNINLTNSPSRHIEHLLNKNYNELTLGDLNALELYFSNQPQSNRSLGLSVNSSALNLGDLDGLIISLKNKRSIDFKQNSPTHPMLKLVQGFSPEEIEALIRAILENGISDFSDLSHVLNLLAEIGLSASPALLSDINESLQDFIENLASTIANPIELLTILASIGQIAQNLSTENINMDSVSSKLTQLLSASTENESNQVLSAAEGLPFHLNIIPAPSQNETENTKENEPNKISEQVAGALNLQTSKKQELNSSNLDSVPKVETKNSITSIEDSAQSNTNSNQQNPEEIETFLKNLDLLLKQIDPGLADAVLELMGNLYKDNLNTTLDDTIDSAFDKLDIDI